MQIDHENHRLTGRLSATLGLLSVALAGTAAIFMCARHFSTAWREADELGFDAGDEQAVTVRGAGGESKGRTDVDY